MASGYESLSNLELRQKLLDVGYDLPISVKKDFMIKTLERVTQERRKQQLQGRKSMPAVPTSRQATKPASNNNHQFETNSNASSRSRQSTGSSRASLPKQTLPLPLQLRSPVNDEILEEDVEDDEEEEEEESSPEPTPRFSNRTNRGSTTTHYTSYTREPEAEGDYQEDEEDEEEENRTPSPRYQKYLSYFKGDIKADPFVMPRSGYNSPIGSPYSTTATAGSPSFRRNQSYDFDDSADESDTEQLLPVNSGRMHNFFSKVNPVNWMPNPKSWISSRKRQEQETDSKNQLNFNFGSETGGTSRSTLSPSNQTPTRSPTNSSSINGHFTSSSGRAMLTNPLANQIYSPLQPSPVVPPAMAAGRQAGFKAFFSRGERNGFGYPSASGASADSAHLVPKMLLVGFIVAVVGVLGAYYYKASVQPGLPGPEGDGDLSAFFGGEGKASKSPIAAPPKPKRTRAPTKLVYPICGQPGYETEPFCVERSIIQDSTKLFEALKSELTQRSERKSCGDIVEDKISLLKAKEFLYRLVDMKKTQVDNAFNGMLMLVTENPTSGVRIFGNRMTEDVKIQDIATLNNEQSSITVEGVSPTFYCMIVGFIFSIVTYILYLLFVTILGYGLYRVIRYRQQRQARDDEEMFSMIDSVVNMLHQHYETAKDNGQDQFVAVNHIRDAMFSHRDKKLKEALWNKVVAEISTNESRVREEIQHISGEEFKVWRWLPSASPLSKRMSSAPSSPRGSGDAPSGLYPNLPSMDTSVAGGSGASTPSNSQWQGQAFEILDGSPNFLAQPPTTCLKIRQMFDNSKDAGDFRIEQAILEKCNNAKILHIGIDRTTREGCVYIRCLTKMDARTAYGSLHGWWFDGHLLSVKFLREDRYFTRFPDAKFRTVPLTSTTLSSSSSPPLMGHQSYNNNMNTMSPQQGRGGPSPRTSYSTGY